MSEFILKSFTFFMNKMVSLRFSWRDATSTSRGAVFNLAEDIALIRDMPYMAYKLLRRMRSDSR